MTEARHGRLIVYHGVCDQPEPGTDRHHLCYSAGVMILSREHPRELLYWSSKEVLTPTLAEEQYGTIDNVVFPTCIDRRDDIGAFDRFDVYYGMADNRIGVARLDVPEHLPLGAQANPHLTITSLPLDDPEEAENRYAAMIATGEGFASA